MKVLIARNTVHLFLEILIWKGLNPQNCRKSTFATFCAQALLNGTFTRKLIAELCLRTVREERLPLAKRSGNLVVPPLVATAINF